MFVYLSQEKREFRTLSSVLSLTGDNYCIDGDPLTLP